MKRFGFVVEMGADEGRSAEQIEEDLLKIPGVVDAFLELETGEGEVTISDIADNDAATLKAQLEATLKKPLKILFDVPTPPVDCCYGAMQAPPPPHVPWYPVPAQPLGPYVRYNRQPPHAPPPSPPYAGYYHTPYYGGRPYNFKDDYDHGCSCSIQ